MAALLTIMWESSKGFGGSMIVGLFSRGIQRLKGSIRRLACDRLKKRLCRWICMKPREVHLLVIFSFRGLIGRLH
jgi:hypothetical protein